MAHQTQLPKRAAARNDVSAAPPCVAPKIHAAPKIRQIYWCSFWTDVILPEMHKKRPVVIISHKNTLYGPCLVLPTSTDPQEGKSAEWAYKLSIRPDGSSDTWVVCNHLYTVSPSRLEPLHGPVIPRLPEDEFNEILAKALKWLPSLRLPEKT